MTTAFPYSSVIFQIFRIRKVSVVVVIPIAADFFIENLYMK